MKERKRPLQSHRLIECGRGIASVNRKENNIGAGVVAELRTLIKQRIAGSAPCLQLGADSQPTGESLRGKLGLPLAAAVTLNQIHRTWQSEGESMQEI